MSRQPSAGKSIAMGPPTPRHDHGEDMMGRRSLGTLRVMTTNAEFSSVRHLKGTDYNKRRAAYNNQKRKEFQEKYPLRPRGKK
jgi:hypothetical protein